MDDGGYACNIFLKSHAMSQTRISPACGPFHKDEMGADEVS
jgi:hypothetical protein